MFPPIVVSPESGLLSVSWVHPDRVLAVNRHYAADALWAEIYLVTPSTGEVRKVEAGLRGGMRESLAGPTEDGRVLLARAAAHVRPLHERDPRERVPYSLHWIDTEAVSVQQEPILEESGAPHTAHWRLSPSGRYWIRDVDPGERGSLIIRDLEKGTDIPVGEGVHHPRWRRWWNGPPRSIRWLAGDHLAWAEMVDEELKLLVGRPGEAPREVGSWKASSAELSPSPDLERAGLWLWDAELRKYREHMVFEVNGDRIYQFGEAEPWAVHWAGPNTLAHTTEGGLVLQDLDDPENVRRVFGPREDGPEDEKKVIYILREPGD